MPSFPSAPPKMYDTQSELRAQRHTMLNEPSSGAIHYNNDFCQPFTCMSVSKGSAPPGTTVGRWNLHDERRSTKFAGRVVVRVTNLVHKAAVPQE